MHRLLRYDLRIAWRGARSALSRKRDLLLLLVGLPLIALLAARGFSDAVAAAAGLPAQAKLGAAGAVGFLVTLAVGGRLKHLQEDSVMARKALRASSARAYLLSWNTPFFVASLGIMLIGSPSPTRLALSAGLAASYAVGGGLGMFQRRGRIGQGLAKPRLLSGGLAQAALQGETRRQRIVQLVTRRTGLWGASPGGNLALLFAAGASAGLAYVILTDVVAAPDRLPEFVVGLPVLLLLGLLLRQHPPLFRYLSYLGVGPVGPALVPALFAAALLGGLIAAAMATGTMSSASPALAAGVVLLGFVVIALVRALHYAVRPRQQAEIAMQLDIAALLLVGFLALPLAVVLLIVRLAMMVRRTRQLRYMLP